MSHVPPAKQLTGRCQAGPGGPLLKPYQVLFSLGGCPHVPPCIRASQCSPSLSALLVHTCFTSGPAASPPSLSHTRLHHTLAQESPISSQTQKDLKLMPILFHLQTYSEFTFSRSPRLSIFPTALICPFFLNTQGKVSAQCTSAMLLPSPLPRPSSSLYFLKNLSRCFLFSQWFLCQFGSSCEL